MVQFNLLPDVKKEYIKARRTKRLILTVSTLAVAGSLAVTVVLFLFVAIAQNKSIDDLSEDISSDISTLRSTNDLDKILTIQSQLDALPELHQQKPELSRAFEYLIQLTPADIKIQEVKIDNIENTMQITGSASDLASINRFADTLKFSRYSTPDEKDKVPFSSVITTLNRNEEKSTYEIDVVYDPQLFDNSLEIKMVVPENKVTTRSTLGKPDLSNNDLFEESDNQDGEQ